MRGARIFPGANKASAAVTQVVSKLGKSGSGLSPDSPRSICRGLRAASGAGGFRPDIKDGNFFLGVVSVASFPVAAGRQRRQSEFEMPTGPAVAGDVEGEFKTSPDAEFVEGGPQIVLDHLFTGSEDAGDIPVGKTLPDQGRDLNLLGS
jgi:hypothetical protein